MDHAPTPTPRRTRRSQTVPRLAVQTTLRTAFALSSLALITPSTPTHAQPVAAPSTSADLPAQLAALEVQLRDPKADPALRAQAAAQADDLRARLISAHPADPRIAGWLADRAAYQLDLAAASGLDLVCLFGLPTPAQAASVRPFAESALQFAQQADQSATASIAALEARLLDRARPPSPAELAAIESRLATLVEIEQARRIPTLRALARTLLAATTNDPARAASAAQDAVRDLRPIAPPTPEAKRAHQIAMGAALLHSTAGDHAGAAADLAHAQFRAIELAGADPDTALRARLGMIRTGVLKPHPAAPLEAEAAAAFLVHSSSRDLATRPQRIADAVRTLFATAPTAAEVAAGTPDTRTLICDKIASILPRTVPIQSLPPEAAFCKAVTLARAAKPEDTRTRDEAVSLFTLAADNPSAAPALRCAARWERAVVLAQALPTAHAASIPAAASPDELAAFDALARVFTEDPACTESLAAARRTADTFLRRNPPGATVTPTSPDWSPRKSVYRAALTLLLEREPDDRWRIEFIRLAAADLAAPAQADLAHAADAGALPAPFERAATLIDQLSTEAARSAARPILADALAAYMDRRRSTLLALPAPETTSAWKSLIPAAARTLEWSRVNDPPRVPLYTLTLGEARASIGDAQALALLAPLSGTPIDQPDAPQFVRFRFALSKAQRLNNEPAKAFTTLREAADRLEGAPGTTARDPAFWAAWAEMLTILQTLNTDGSRSADIRVQIQRLELLDPALGGPPHADAIKKIRDSLTRPG